MKNIQNIQNILKALVPVIAVAFIGCASTPEPQPVVKAPVEKKAKDDSKEVHKVQY